MMFKFAGNAETLNNEALDHVGVGLSEDFKKIQEFIIKQKEAILKQISLSDLIESIKQTIASLKENASDFEDVASAVSINNAINFIELLPCDGVINFPDVLTDGDNGVAFEWRAEDGNIFVLTFTPEGSVVYAGLIKKGERHGTEVIEGKKIPNILLHSIRSISILQG